MGQATRTVYVRNLKIGGGNPVVIQSMCATPTRDVKATLSQVRMLHEAGALIIRIAVDHPRDIDALKEIRKKTKALLVVDLQENYPLAEAIAPYVDKIRYNPGHLHHLEKETTVEKKVEKLIAIAKQNGCALRIGVNCGSVAPEFMAKCRNDKEQAIVESASWHCSLMEKLGFANYVVSLKDSDPQKVVRINTAFAGRHPEVPLHLGVTEAGMPPEGVLKTRAAFEQLLPKGIGDTVRVSLTVPFEHKSEEVKAARAILDDIAQGRFLKFPQNVSKGLNIISCPSCSRVENRSFIELAERVREISAFAKDKNLVIAVMGCRVNGPGETDDADLGLWCGPTKVTLKEKSRVIGAYGYGEVLEAVRARLEALSAAKG